MRTAGRPPVMIAGGGEQAAPGVDNMTWQDYEADLELRIEDLHGRVHRGAYRPQPSRRATYSGRPSDVGEPSGARRLPNLLAMT
jgi:hypothetical protein